MLFALFRQLLDKQKMVKLKPFVQLYPKNENNGGFFGKVCTKGNHNLFFLYFFFF